MDKDKIKKMLKVLGLVTLFIVVFGLSYALFQVSLNGIRKVRIKSGKLELQLLDSNDRPIYITNSNTTTSYEINLDNQVPIDDETGLSTTGFTFKLKNTGNISAKYKIYLDDNILEDGEDRISDSYIRYSLTKNNSSDKAKNLISLGTNPNRKLDVGIINDNEINIYTLKIWIKESADNNAMDKTFSTTLRVEAIQFLDPITTFKDGTMASDLCSKGILKEYSAENKISFFNKNRESSGLYKYIDEEAEITYVYRGNPSNNYVTFAEQTWRILRIQSDGTVKLVRSDALDYESNRVVSSGNGYKNVRYNNEYHKDVLSKYTNSNIERYLNEWYQDVMLDYDDKIAKNKYCSDRYEPIEKSQYRKEIAPSAVHLYGIFNRLEFSGIDNKDSYRMSPSVSCTSGDVVNAKAALITADEYVLVSGTLGTSYNYLQKPAYAYWTMSPSAYINYTAAYIVDEYANINKSNVYLPRAVIPVITLKRNTIITSGEGTKLNPYVIS